jgi:hypothetical protein
MKHWVKQSRKFKPFVALYTNILTFDKVLEANDGKFYVAHENKLCDKPTDVFVVKDFKGWDFYSGGYIDEEQTILSYGSYCCDGDGFVSVELLVDGSIRLLDQGDFMLDLSPNLDEAMKQATDYLKEQYPEIYEMWLAYLQG